MHGRMVIVDLDMFLILILILIGFKRLSICYQEIFQDFDQEAIKKNINIKY